MVTRLAQNENGRADGTRDQMPPDTRLRRWTLPRQLQVGCSPCDQKVRSFKTLSSDFSDFFSLDSSLHDIVACCLLGNYPSSSSRPNWESRLTIYENYVRGKSTVTQGWLKRCDYITFYAIRELVVEVLPHNIGIMNMIKSCPEMNDAWNQYVMDTKSIANRMRSGINDFLSETLIDIHDSVKNRHNRCVKSGFADGALSEGPHTDAAEAPTAWSGQHSSYMLNSLLRGGARVTAAKSSQISKSMAEEFERHGCPFAAAAIKADVSRAVHISSNIHMFVLPVDYTMQLIDSLSRGQDRQLSNGSMHKDTPCSCTEDAVRRCTMYTCTRCYRLMNHVIDETTDARETRLKFRHVVRIDIDDGELKRYCDACLEKGSARRMELLELPLLRRGEAAGEWSCSAISVFDRVVNVCPRCTLLVERQNLKRCPISGDWCCVMCRI